MEKLTHFRFDFLKNNKKRNPLYTTIIGFCLLYLSFLTFSTPKKKNEQSRLFLSLKRTFVQKSHIIKREFN